MRRPYTQRVKPLDPLGYHRHHQQPEYAGVPTPVVYVSIDVETNGPVPGIFSLLSIGIAAFDTFGRIVYESEHNLLALPDAREDETTMKWWRAPEQAAAWNHLSQDRRPPEEVFKKLAQDFRELRKLYRVFTVAWPACFDWMFLQWYMYKYVGENPLGRTAKCAVTFAWALSKTATPNVDISSLLEKWEDNRYKHTHCALDDAREQGAKFINMLRENTRSGQDARIKTKK